MTDKTSLITGVAEVFKEIIPSRLRNLSQTNKAWKEALRKECEDGLHTTNLPDSGDCGICMFDPGDSSPSLKGKILCQIQKSTYFDKQVIVRFGVHANDAERFSTSVIETLLKCVIKNFTVLVYIHSENEPALLEAIKTLSNRNSIKLGIGSAKSHRASFHPLPIQLSYVGSGGPCHDGSPRAHAPTIDATSVRV